MHNEQHHDLSSSPNTTRAIKQAGHVACKRKARRAYRYFQGKRGRNKPLSRPRRRGEGYIKICPK
jgi:hypothetical protein